MHNFSKPFLSIAGLKIAWERLITANSIAYTLKWIRLLWIYTRARRTLTGFSCLSSLTWIFTQALFLCARRFHEAHARTQPHPAMKVSLSPDLPPALLVQEVTPQTWHMLQQPCIQPCLLPLLKEPLGSLQTWPMMSYIWDCWWMLLLSRPCLPEVLLFFCQREHYPACAQLLAHTLQQTSEPSSSELDQIPLTKGFCCSRENRYIKQEFFPSKFTFSISKLGTNLCLLEFCESCLMLLSFKGREDFYTSLIKN